MKLALNFDKCLDQIKERAWSVVLPNTCIFGNGPLDCPHRAIEGRGINLSSMVKNPNGAFLFMF